MLSKRERSARRQVHSYLGLEGPNRLRFLMVQLLGFLELPPARARRYFHGRSDRVAVVVGEALGRDPRPGTLFRGLDKRRHRRRVISTDDVLGFQTLLGSLLRRLVDADAFTTCPTKDAARAIREVQEQIEALGPRVQRLIYTPLRRRTPIIESMVGVRGWIESLPAGALDREAEFEFYSVIQSYLASSFALIVCPECARMFDPRSGKRERKFCNPQCTIDHHNKRDEIIESKRLSAQRRRDRERANAPPKQEPDLKLAAQ